MSNAPAIVRRIGTRLRVGDDGRVQGWIDLRDDLQDSDGGLTIGALGCLADLVAGTACNRAVPQDEWVMTSDLYLTMTSPVVEGPARIEGTVVRASSTMVVADIDVVDEGLGRVVGGGSVGHRVRPAAVVRPDTTPIGEIVDHSVEVDGVGLIDHLELRRSPGRVELELRPELTNPWGVLHGGVTFMAAVEAARHAHGGTGRVGSVHGRYLAPGNAGPIVFGESTVAPGDPSLVRIAVTQAGDDHRPVAHVDVVIFDR